jgi:hypothetical protein
LDCSGRDAVEMDEKGRDLSFCGSECIDSGLMGCDAMWSCRLEVVLPSKTLVIACKVTWYHNLRGSPLMKRIHRKI